MESQSHLLGQFIATMHIMEHTVPSEESWGIAKTMEEFMNAPVSTFVICQTKIAKIHQDLLDLRKNILIDEIKRIYQELDTDNLKNLLFDKCDFTEGYQLQLCWSKYVNI